MTFVLLKNYDHYVIVNDDADFIVGRVYCLNGQRGPYEVTSRIGPSYQPDDIALVKSLDDAIPTFIDYYEKNPVPWERESSAFYSRYTMFVCLWVEQVNKATGSRIAMIIPYFKTRCPRVLLLAPMLNEPLTRTSATCFRTPRQLTMASRGFPILRSKNARSRTELSSVLAENGVRPAYCLDLADKTRLGGWWSRDHLVLKGARDQGSLLSR
jgi:hypothetical protein